MKFAKDTRGIERYIYHLPHALTDKNHAVAITMGCNST